MELVLKGSDDKNLSQMWKPAVPWFYSFIVDFLKGMTDAMEIRLVDECVQLFADTVDDLEKGDVPAALQKIEQVPTTCKDTMTDIYV